MLKYNKGSDFQMNEKYISLLIFLAIIITIYIIKLKKDISNNKIKKYKEETSEKKQLYCIYCGKKINDDTIPCYWCGKKQIIEKKPTIKNINYKEHYTPREYILTKSELEIYKILTEIANELNLTLLSQVSLYSILRSKKGNDKYFNKIKSKSIDFVLIDKMNSKIKLCIELDDKTHEQKERIERDNFINQLFKDLKIQLLRIKVNNYYNKIDIENQIMKAIYVEK